MKNDEFPQCPRFFVCWHALKDICKAPTDDARVRCRTGDCVGLAGARLPWARRKRISRGVPFKEYREEKSYDLRGRHGLHGELQFGSDFRVRSRISCLGSRFVYKSRGNLGVYLP